MYNSKQTISVGESCTVYWYEQVRLDRYAAASSLLSVIGWEKLAGNARQTQTL